MLLFRQVACIALVSLLSAAGTGAGELYRWIDREGNVHFSDTPASIPPEYQDQVEVQEMKGFGNEPAGPPGDADAGTPDSPEPESAAGQKVPARYEVSYTAHEGSAKRIIIPVKINGSVTARMALDTGAPGTLISFRLARRLGILDENEGALLITAGGIGGSAPALRTIIDEIDINGAVTSFIPATVVQIRSDAFEGLIGLDIMSRYQLKIDPRKHVVIMEEIPPEPDMPGGHDEEWWRNHYREFAAYKDMWKSYLRFLEKKLSEPELALSTRELIFDLIAFSKRQYREAEKLFFRLNSYATDNAVPMPWRVY